MANTLAAQEVLVVDVIEVGVVIKEVLRFVVITAVSGPDYDFYHLMRARKSKKCRRYYFLFAKLFFDFLCS